MGRKHFFNEKYFEKIETEEQAYWLGFITADGSITNHSGTYAVEIGLAERDKNHLDKLIKLVGYDGSYRKKAKECSVSLTLYSKTMVSDLLKLGVEPRKSFTSKPWDGPIELMPHYWRGVFDGDGGISVSQRVRSSGRKYIGYSVTLVGTYDIVSAFELYIRQHTLPPYNHGRISKHGSIWSVSYGGVRPSQNVVSVLYTKSNISLDRKYILSNEILEYKLDPPIIKHLTLDYLHSKYEELGYWKEVAKSLGISKIGLHKHRKKLGDTRVYKKHS